MFAIPQIFMLLYPMIAYSRMVHLAGKSCVRRAMVPVCSFLPSAMRHVRLSASSSDAI
jgi:hypothetical protein